tara:strand:+ start:3572 stop:4021 length:450 start_codon:yes stop_codon:yes gene_type:complete
MSDEWRVRVAELAQAAQAAAAEGDYPRATDGVQEALEVIEAEGSAQDVVFAIMLLVAADIALATGAHDSAASLYERVAWVCDTIETDADAGDLNPIRARALLGMGRSVAPTDPAAARGHYEACLALLAASPEPTPESVLATVRAELTAL